MPARTVKFYLETVQTGDGIRKTQGQLESFERQTGNIAKRISGNFRSVGRTLTTAGRGISTFATLPIVGGFAVAFKAASDFNEQASKMVNVFGDAQSAVATFAHNAATSVGLSRTAALEATGTFGNMFNQLGFGAQESAKFSIRLTQAAADLGSFHNADITEVIEAQTAAFRGEYDSLQRFIPTISAATVQQLALEQTGKKNASQLTAQEKAAATYTIMLRDMGKAQGDFQRTSEGAANQQRIIQARFQDAITQLGQQLIPIFLQVAEVVTGLFDKFNSLSPSVKRFILIAAGVLAILGPVVGIIGALATVIGLIISPVGLVIIAIAALAAGAVYAYKNFEGFRNVVDGVVAWFTGTAIPGISAAIDVVVEKFGHVRDWAMEVWPQVSEAVRHAFNVIRDIVIVVTAVVSAIWDRFGELILQRARIIWTMIYTVISGVMGTIRGIIDFFLAIINGEWGKAWEALRRIFANIWQIIMGLLRGFLALMRNSLAIAWEVIKSAASNAWTGIKNVINGVWEGIKTGTKNALKWIFDNTLGRFGALARGISGVWSGISRAIGNAWDGIKSLVRSAVNFVIGIINGLIRGINFVLGKLGLGRIDTITPLGAQRRNVAGGTVGGARPTGFATGGVLPLGQAGPFMTNGPMAVVGEGNRAFPEYVIPTDPKFRGRALGLLGQLTGDLVPGMAIGGILGGIGDAFKGGFGWVKDRIGSVAGTVFRKALEAAFAGPNAIAKAALSRAPNPFGVADIVNSLRETVWQWVKGADSALPEMPAIGAGVGGGSLTGLEDRFEAIVRRILSLGGGAISLVSGFRSRAQQAALYARWIAGVPGQAQAAPPGRSKHEVGLAVDWGGNIATYTRLSHLHDLVAPVRGEHWHWQPKWAGQTYSYYARGGQIPAYQNGGILDRTGLYFGHRGEEITPANARGRQVTNYITINVNGGDPMATVEVLKRYMRSNGPVPIKITG